eukprot:4160607-Alexandrium_andersonii.AAC.1
MSASLVGSEMCIRDRLIALVEKMQASVKGVEPEKARAVFLGSVAPLQAFPTWHPCDTCVSAWGIWNPYLTLHRLALCYRRSW